MKKKTEVTDIDKIYFAIKGKKGAVQLVLSVSPLSADMTYYSQKPRYIGQLTMNDCQYMKDTKCYSETFTVEMIKLYDMLCTDNGIWDELEKCYNILFKQKGQKKDSQHKK